MLHKYFSCGTDRPIMNAVCSAIYDSDSKALIISRFDSNGSFIASLPDFDIAKFTESWHELMQRNNKQLTVTAAEAEKWSENDKKKWWDDRQKLNFDLDSFL